MTATPLAMKARPPRDEPAGALREGFRPDIEGLRGVAVLLVIAFHSGIPGASGGFVGVDVFFVLSGYLISGLLLSELRSKGRLSLIGFYARRVRRLLPASGLVFLATLVGVFFVYAPFEVAALRGSFLSVAAYVGNLWFAGHTAQYFGPG